MFMKKIIAFILISLLFSTILGINTLFNISFNDDRKQISDKLQDCYYYIDDKYSIDNLFVVGYANIDITCRIPYISIVYKDDKMIAYICLLNEYSIDNLGNYFYIYYKLQQLYGNYDEIRNNSIIWKIDNNIKCILYHHHNDFFVIYENIEYINELNKLGLFE